MEFKEFGKEDGKTLLLLPGTACRWEFNFGKVVDALAERYHIIAVNYDGFEGDPSVLYTDVPTVTRKIEDYVIKHHSPYHLCAQDGRTLRQTLSAAFPQS